MYRTYRPGWIEVICGCMFAGKTEELLRRINVLNYANKKIVAFKPSIDNRYSESKIASHSGSYYDCVCVDCNDLSPIRKVINDSTIDAVIIEEVQFLSEEIVEICEELANHKKRVIVAGLDMDFRGVPFKNVDALMARAEFVTKLAAVCNKCGGPATRTQRLINGEPAHFNDPVVLVGAKECYEARCRWCHEVKKD